MTENQRTVRVVGVRFSPIDPVRFFDPADTDPAVGDRVIVESESGPREGVVAIAPSQVLYSELRGQLAPVLQQLGVVEDQ